MIQNLKKIFSRKEKPQIPIQDIEHYKKIINFFQTLNTSPNLKFFPEIPKKFKKIRKFKSSENLKDEIDKLKNLFNQLLENIYGKSVPEYVKKFSIVSSNLLKRDFSELSKEFKKFLKNPIIGDFLPQTPHTKNLTKTTLDNLTLKEMRETIEKLSTHILTTYITPKTLFSTINNSTFLKFEKIPPKGKTSFPIFQKQKKDTFPQKEPLKFFKEFHLLPLDKRLMVFEEFFASNANRFRKVIEESIRKKYNLIVQKSSKIIFSEIDSWFTNKNEQLKYIENLDLREQKISFIFNQIFFFKNLKKLDLGHNELKNIPKTFSELINLEVLNLENNGLENFTEELLILRKLKILYLTTNKLKSFPNPEQQKNHLSSLKVLFLSENNISVIPIGLFTLPNLDSIFCHKNPLNISNFLIKKENYSTKETIKETILKKFQNTSIEKENPTPEVIKEKTKMENSNPSFKEYITTIQYDSFENRKEKDSKCFKKTSIQLNFSQTNTLVKVICNTI